MNKQGKLHLLGNLLGLLIICSILVFVLLEQLIIHDLPCPICLLQRVCYIAIGLAMLMNLCLGLRPAHYGLMILAALLGLAISVHQISLHLAPGDMGYGSLILGHHLYTWAAIVFAVIIMFIALALIFDQGFHVEYKIQHPWFKVFIALFLFLILANGVSTFILCGPFPCPGNPTQYYF